MVKVNTGTMGTQASTVTSRVSALNNAISQLSAFAGEGSLQGAAYENAKIYATGVLTLLLQSMILYSESVSEGTIELQSLYASICGGEDLDSDDLETKITNDNNSLRAAEKLLDALNHDEGASKGLKSAQAGNISSLRRCIKSNQKKLEPSDISKIIIFTYLVVL
ncbi:hypothetical protein N1495_00650 [Streptococcus didelphis]|uniref:LXG domain-containing protein n=1 Tax=Streptococcus didelphis TaxID=102886 RepID=A0ABY9LGB1_9STRE|nr:hypothetical protein [Streptococcus didelphis]WMB27932.1 hypothetical protein N1496_07905 [Streptococcus didelphis]WMB29600.1 hypothetical protein N1495_00650 [Streptococcus didelphis]